VFVLVLSQEEGSRESRTEERRKLTGRRRRGGEGEKR
jgi:hypothetical protein